MLDLEISRIILDWSKKYTKDGSIICPACNYTPWSIQWTKKKVSSVQFQETLIHDQECSLYDAERGEWNRQFLQKKLFLQQELESILWEEKLDKICIGVLASIIILFAGALFFV
jgi:hypothetical protein